MSEGLLKTKLFPPTVRQRIVIRYGLLEKLNAGLEGRTPFTLVSAPAGFGKTTLVGDWVKSTGLPHSWLTLDAGDNDLVRFWRYIDTAFRTIDEHLGESLRPALFSPQPPTIHRVITGLLNDIVEKEIVFVLVIEDYHVIGQADVHESVNFLLDHLPPGMSLVLTTRSDPPLNLALRRGRGQITELRASDLRFSLDEVADFLNEKMRLGLIPEDIEALETRTEGWVAGLQMAALSLQDEPDPHAFIQAFSGDDRYIADYLIEEVLQRQPHDFQRFLLQTSILNRLIAPLCDTVTGRSDSQAVLNALERANLFILPLDNRREWFRYHQLFAQLLRKRLLDTEGENAVTGLKQAASRWYAEHGHIVEAVEMVLESGDFDQAASLIEQFGSLLFTGAELNALQKWTEILPETVISARPRLNVMAAWANHATGHPDRADQLVRIVERTAGLNVEQFLTTLSEPTSLSPILRHALLEGAVVLTRIAVDSLDLQRAFTLAEQTLPYLVPIPPDEPYAFNLPIALRCAQLFNLGVAYQFKGDLAQAAEVLAESAREAEIALNPHIIALALGHLGETQILQGELELARTTFERALAAAETFPPRSSAFWGVSSVGLGNLSYEWNELTDAERYLQEGVKLGKTWNSWESLLPGMLGLADMHATRGEWNQAYDLLADLLGTQALNALPVRPAVEWARARIQLWQGNIHAAAAWAHSFQLDQTVVDKLQWMRDALLAARIALVKGEFDRSNPLIETLLRETQQAGCGRCYLEALILKAISLEYSKQNKAAQATLEAALALAEPSGFVRLFIEQGEVIQALLIQMRPALAGDPRLGLYGSKILSAFDAEGGGAQQGLIEPLTERELEVLEYIAQGLTNPEIAAILFLSPNTLKAHAQNIFSKLNVHNRVQATNKAKALGLIAE